MPNSPRLYFKRLHPEQDKDIPLPAYMTAQASGMDIRAAISEALVLAPGDVALIPTGISMALPPGYEAQIRPRSGLAIRHGIGVINSPGTIDSDYRGEVMVPLINFGRVAVTLNRGDRVAQMVIQKVYRLPVEVTDSLDETERGAGGFGHTGI
jgi:dUTP pyrophosphatase